MLQQIHANERDYPSACGLLGIGSDYAGLKHAEHTKALFLLSKAMVNILFIIFEIASVLDAFCIVDM